MVTSLPRIGEKLLTANITILTGRFVLLKCTHNLGDSWGDRGVADNFVDKIHNQQIPEEPWKAISLQTIKIILF